MVRIIEQDILSTINYTIDSLTSSKGTNRNLCRIYYLKPTAFYNITGSVINNQPHLILYYELLLTAYKGLDRNIHRIYSHKPIDTLLGLGLELGLGLGLVLGLGLGLGLGSGLGLGLEFPYVRMGDVCMYPYYFQAMRNLYPIKS